MALIDMQLSAEEARKEASCAPCTDGDSGEDDGPKYPWGLSLSLDDETLAKLGITALPEIGTTMTLTARVQVCSTSQYANQKSTDKSVSLQVTAMELGTAETPEGQDAATLLYGDAV